jgi:uncharacterized membrane protein YccC
MLIVACLVSLVVALVWYRMVPRYAFAFVGSTLTTAFLVWAIGQSHFGWMDTVFFRNLAVTFAIAAGGSIVVGVWRQMRERKRNVN